MKNNDITNIESAIVDNGKNVILNSIEELSGIYAPLYMISKYSSIVSEIIDNGFSIFDLLKIINSIYNSAYCNNVDITNIDISETTSDKNCIFFDAYIGVINDESDMEIHIRLNYYREGIQFIEASSCKQN